MLKIYIYRENLLVSVFIENIFENLSIYIYIYTYNNINIY